MTEINETTTVNKPSKKRTSTVSAKGPRHPFVFKIGEGVDKTITAWAKVIPGKKAIPIVLEADHVRNAMKLGGVGNTSTCTMAICARAHAHVFPHSVEGLIDWAYTRAWVATKLNKDGLPCECVVYEHSDSIKLDNNGRVSIAELNDSKGGQKKLLAYLEVNGPVTVWLKPKRVRSEVGRSGKGRISTGKRRRAHLGVGAKLRFAVALLGGVPTTKKSKAITAPETE